MKFWKSLKSSAAHGFSTLDRNGNNTNKRNDRQISTTPVFQRKKKFNNLKSFPHEESIYEEFTPSPSPSITSRGSIMFGTTFVELIKRKGTKLGVVVSGSIVDHGVESTISELVSGSWAQRSDVLCVGDTVVSINGVSTATMNQKDLTKVLEHSDRVQLEVRYPLPPHPPSRQKFLTKVIQVTLKKQNGSFGMVIRGGMHEIARKRRPFTVMNMVPTGPAYVEGTIRVNDRVKSVNGQSLHNMKLAELQSLLYQQDKDTVFTIEYDVAVHDMIENGPVLVEIRRDASDILGFGLNKCSDSGHIFIESIKQASLSDRCGAIHVGDILLSVDSQGVGKMSAEEATNLVRGNSDVVHLEILPGLFSRTYNPFRSSMPSPCFSSLRSQRLRSGGRSCMRYQSMTDIDQHLTSRHGQGSSLPPTAPHLGVKERRKHVTFTVELQRDGGPLGLTLATEADAASAGPIFISALLQDGLAQRTQTIQVNDELVEINGLEVKGKCLNDVIPLLQESSGEVIKLKLARLISIPEREFATLRKSSNKDNEDTYSNFRKPPLPSPSPSRNPSYRSSSRRSSASSTATIIRDFNHSPTPTNSVSLMSPSTLTRSSPSRQGIVRPVPMEVHKVILFKDKVYEDFGFSVSDGLYEKGIFLNRIRKGGPADASGLLRPLDRILQINETRTTDFDCCLAVPLIAAAGDQIELLVARTSKNLQLRNSGQSFISDYSDGLEIIENREALDRTLTRRSQFKRKADPGVARMSRTSSADGRLGSVTSQILPWSPDDPDLAIL